MKNILISLIFLISYSKSYAGNSLPCKIHRTDNMIVFGQCIKIDNIVLFESCAGFICRVNQSLTRNLDKGTSSCSNVKNHKEFSDLVLSEFKSVNLVPFCLYSK